ncbi:DUF4132 domain-containing protein [Tropicibacter naphthalenivorans]|uniref:DUF4132 domain-containing protein n=1 Tax=Tropicibacter naphthalenivorans TaxID=441103 RepID=A0A0P1G1Q1_9RHOB|nr:DUF4132 domain-containing protein [Tropicibacter naphthalenivorans]CUH75557.1 hypothetical protein TRN7648_00499 [Tropicibacter naphthalenivorans]SMC43681.1 protein of unknown function [Tropicibacter naphthalenivorans]
MSLFRKALGALTGRKGSGSDSGGLPLPPDLELLEQAETGMGHAAWDYIQGQGDDSCLARIEQLNVELKAGVHPDHFSRQADILKPRRTIFADLEIEPALVARYIRVLAASMALGHKRGASYHLPVVASAKVPQEVVIYLSERQDLRLGIGTDAARAQATLPQVLAVIEQLGGTAEDLFDAVFSQPNRYIRGQTGTMMKRLSGPDAVRAHPAAFVAQNTRLDLQSREELFKYIVDESLMDVPEIETMVTGALTDSSKKIRALALSAISKLHPLKIDAEAKRLLSDGKAASRLVALDLFKLTGSDAGSKALRAHLDTEKSDRITAAINAYLGITATTKQAEPAPEDTPGYRAQDGSWVEIPPMIAPPHGPLPDPSPEVLDALFQAGETLEAEYQAIRKEGKRTHYLEYASSLPAESYVKGVLRLRSGDKSALNEVKDLRRRLSYPASFAPVAAMFAEIPVGNALQAAVNSVSRFTSFSYGVGHERALVSVINSYLLSDLGDLRYLEKLILAKPDQAILIWGAKAARARRPGDLLLDLYAQGRYGYRPEPYAASVAWPLLAENLGVLDKLLGMVSDPGVPSQTDTALRLLDLLPKVPARHASAVLDIALTGKKAHAKLAQALMRRTGGFEGALTDMLGDSRQAVRATAARMLAEMGYAPAVDALQTRLKKEKSVVAKAAMLSALRAFDQDISAFVGPKALLTEATKGLKKASFKDVDWLDLNTLPQVAYADGTPVPPEVVQWWLAMAVKLKAPGDTGLFELYLDQLRPEDAVTLSTYMFDAWIGYDTAPPSEEAILAHIRKTMRSYGNLWHLYYPEAANMTDDEKVAYLRKFVRVENPNSAASAKGMLALAVRVPPAHAVAKVRSYLRQHGGRTSQTTSLLELMAAKGDALSLQVVIAAATRLRQKSVQARANELVQAVAERNDWTTDQLADRTVPTGGLDDDGRLELPVAAGSKTYVARLDEKLALAVFNPDGKPIKALPAGDDDITKASKKALSAAKKEIKQAVAFQTARLFEAMCVGRAWTPEDWQRDFYEHPLMRKLIERLIWQTLDAEGHPTGSFRPTPEGDFLDNADGDVTLEGVAQIRLAHASTLPPEDTKAWRAHLKDYEVKQLFEQVRANLPRLPEDMAKATDLEDRKGWVTDAFTLRSAVTKAGYERGDALDGGGFDCYTRHFSSEGIVAVLEFTGNHVEQDNIPVAIKTMFFERLPAGVSRGYGSGQKIALGKLPPVMLAECWADLHAIAAKASFDPEWEKVAPW